MTDGRFGPKWGDQSDTVPFAVVSNSKGSFDRFQNETTGPAEARLSALEVAILRDDLKRSGIAMRWVDAEAQIADMLRGTSEWPGDYRRADGTADEGGRTGGAQRTSWKLSEEEGLEVRA